MRLLADFCRLHRFVEQRNRSEKENGKRPTQLGLNRRHA